MAQPFDPAKRTVLGEAVPVAERVSHVLNNGRQGIFTVSISGLLAYETEGSSGRGNLSWFDRTGKVVGSLGEPGDFVGLELSPDRKSAAVVSIDATNNPDIWVYDIARNLPTRFTFDPGIDSGPIWSPDGTTIVWINQTGTRRLLRKAADGKGTAEVLYEDNGAGPPSSWSLNGKFLLFNKNSFGMGNGVGILPLLPEKPGGPLKPTALVDTPFNEARGMFSPDGHWVAYQSNEIYVIPFPGPGGKHQISTTGGIFPRWRPDGKEIFYVGLDNQLMAVEVTLKATSIDVGEVHPLAITVSRNGIPYDVSLDGQRILAMAETEHNSSRRLTLLQNWTTLLKK
jgi:Tol biopolymer transport system component